MAGPRKTCKYTEARIGTETKSLIALRGFPESERVFAKIGRKREREQKPRKRSRVIYFFGRERIANRTSFVLHSRAGHGERTLLVILALTEMMFVCFPSIFCDIWSCRFLETVLLCGRSMVNAKSGRFFPRILWSLPFVWKWEKEYWELGIVKKKTVEGGLQ